MTVIKLKYTRLIKASSLSVNQQLSIAAFEPFYTIWQLYFELYAINLRSKTFNFSTS